MYLVLIAFNGAFLPEAYAFQAVFYSLSVRAGQTEDFYDVQSSDLHLLL